MRSTLLVERWRSLLLLLPLVTLLLVTGCSRGAKKSTVPGEEWADDLRSRIDRHIGDPQKKVQLMNLIDQDVKIFRRLAQETSTYKDKIVAVDRNFHSTADDFRSVITEYNQTRYQLRDQSMEVRFNMKELCTLEEWHHVSGFRTKKGLFFQISQTPGID